ncbi:ankyrin repeat domain-containing protein [Microtetraspora malaysiensis]|uniref:ankyrin repeat domain-containing protein n=1 Tax=Microtetraspora malaysiensis TaxID=161358 RepID=UPI00082B3FE6|nr:ankyrin repeat domain-containing protein [Microtetraspora malaysiensis]
MDLSSSGWSGIDCQDWTKLDVIRARLDAGADPDSGPHVWESALQTAAREGSPEVVVELARRVTDVDAESDGRTALWDAVFENRPDNARALVSAGADPWRPMMSGWSPGRLSLVTRHPGLFGTPPGGVGLSAEETAAVAEARRLITSLGSWDDDGMSLACVAGIDAAEAARRLAAVPANEAEVEEIMEDPFADMDASLALAGITDVPGGCVLSQMCDYALSTPGVGERLSTGTVCYSMFANPKSGNQGGAFRDGVTEDWDAHPGGGSVDSGMSALEILTTFLYQGHAVAYCCARAGLRLPDARAFTGTPDMWVRLPGDYWH